MIPKEVPVIGPSYTPSSASNPVYKDENVTVYALPLVPGIQDSPLNSGSENINTASVAPVKRKRSLSAESPSKRPHQANEKVTHDSSDLNTSVQELSKAPGFNPQDLRGELAQQWRELLVRNIFVQSQPAPTQKAQNTSGKGAGGKAKKSVPPQKAEDMPLAPVESSSMEQGFGSSPLRNPTPPALASHRPAYINGFNDQLPAFSLAPDALRNTVETKPTLAYAIVGPRIRGKFDAAKAKELRIPNGMQRRALTQGETITFKVKEADGKMVEKTVKPEEVIGASEAPSVRHDCSCHRIPASDVFPYRWH